MTTRLGAVAQAPSTPVLAPATGNPTPLGRIHTGLARVYYGGGRRWLSRGAAYRHEAIARVKRAYPCDCDGPEPEVGYGGSTCERHSRDPKRWGRLVRRLARFLRFLDRLDRKRGAR